MVKKLFTVFILVISFFACPSLSFGAGMLEDLGEFFQVKSEDFEGVILGGGALYQSSPYDEADANIYPIPIIIGKYKNLYFDGSSVGYILNDYILKDNKDLQLSVVLDPRMQGYHSDDSTPLNGMEDREWSLDAGLRLKWINEYFVATVTGLTDIMSRHEGQEVKAVISKELYKGFITPRAGVKWQSQDLVNYYYGVLSDEARATRAAYEPDSSTNFIAGFNVGVPMGEHWALVGDFEYECLGSDIKDSPIVEENALFTYVGGLVYRF